MLHETSGRDGNGNILCSGRYANEKNVPSEGSCHKPGMKDCPYTVYSYLVAQGDINALAIVASKLGEVEGHTGESSGGEKARLPAYRLDGVLSKLVDMGFSREKALRGLEVNGGVLSERTLDFLLQLTHT